MIFGLDFLNSLFLAGAATFSIPIVIHLIFRMRKRRVVFSSLRFLQQSVLKESRRLRLRELILLLLRCLACILIAMAFARPFRPDAALAGADGQPQQDLIIVLDDSPSSLAQDGAGPRWQDLLKKAREEISKRQNGDRVGLIFASSPARLEVEPTPNFDSIRSELDKAKDWPLARRGDLAAAMSTAIDTLANSQQPLRRLVLFSDFQENQVDRGAWATLAQKAAAGRGVAVDLIPASEQPTSRLPNLAITDIRAKSDIWIENRAVPFVIRVANHGENEQPNVSVRLVVDGKPVATRTVGLGPKSSTEIELGAVFPRAGEASGKVELDGRDAFPEDDSRLFALRLRNSLKALVIEETLAEKDTFLDEGYYVRMALKPEARGERSSADASLLYVDVDSRALAQVTPAMTRAADLIVVVGVTTMTDEQVAMLEEAVRDGHSLIVFPGKANGRYSETFYNGAFWKGGRGLLPARPGRVYEGEQKSGKFHRIDTFKADHPLFRPFAGTLEEALRRLEFYRHFQADPADVKAGSDGDNPRPPGDVLATFDDATPFVMERSFGRGNVLMFNVPPRREATNLPTRKAFVVLLHQALRHIVGVQSASRRNLIAGDSFDFADAGAAPDDKVVLERPDKEKRETTGKQPESADLLGLYTASFQKSGLTERTLWAVGLDPRESELAVDNVSGLKAIFASVASDGADVAGSKKWTEDQKRQAPDWWYFLLAAVGCLLLEALIRDFGRRTT